MNNNNSYSYQGKIILSTINKVSSSVNVYGENIFLCVALCNPKCICKCILCTINDLFTTQCAKERLFLFNILVGKSFPFSAPIMKHFPG